MKHRKIFVLLVVITYIPVAMFTCFCSLSFYNHHCTDTYCALLQTRSCSWCHGCSENPHNLVGRYFTISFKGVYGGVGVRQWCHMGQKQLIQT